MHYNTAAYLKDMCGDAPTMPGWLANGNRKVELHRGTLKDMATESVVNGFVIQAGTNTLVLTAKQAEDVLRLLVVNYNMEKYKKMVEEADWNALLDALASGVLRGHKA